MPDLPSHSDYGPSMHASADEDSGAPRPRWRRFMWIAIVVVALLAMVILHVTGVVGAQTN